MNECTLCPRRCGCDRETSVGYCGVDRRIRVAKVMLHEFEEPCISLGNGSGAVFFSGCGLGCCYCQNGRISREAHGKVYSYSELKKTVAALIDRGAENLNFVTAAQYADVCIKLVKDLKPSIPVIYNSGGYESVETIRRLSEGIDVFLPDFKYMSAQLADRYSNAPDYPEVARAAIAEMYRARPECVFDDRGKILRGTVIRHLVLPGCRADSIAVVRYIAEHFPACRLSLMRQFTPQFVLGDYPELKRCVTSFEYDSVLSVVASMGIDGYMQEQGCADTSYTPDFE